MKELFFMSYSIDDFDWDKFESQKFGGAYSKDERAELERMYGDTLNTVQEEEVIKVRSWVSPTAM